MKSFHEADPGRIGGATRIARLVRRVVGASPRAAGRVNPRRKPEAAPMTHGPTGSTMRTSTADHRSRENEMDALTLLLLAIAILLTLDVAAAQLR
jgi:hypothetical protein